MIWQIVLNIMENLEILNQSVKEEVTDQEQKEDQRMIIQVEIINADATKDIFHTQLYTLTSSKNIMGELLLVPLLEIFLLEEEEAVQKKFKEMIRTSKKHQNIGLILITMRMVMKLIYLIHQIFRLLKFLKQS